MQRLLEERLRFEAALSEIFSTLMHGEAGDPDAALASGLRQAVGCLGADRGHLVEYVDSAPAVRVSWAKPTPADAAPVPLGGPLSRMALSTALHAHGRSLGVLTIESVCGERGWGADTQRRLRLLSEAFAGALEHRRMKRSLAKRGRLPQLLSQLSAGVGNAALGHDDEIEGALRWIVAFLAVDGAALIEFTRPGRPALSWRTGRVVDEGGCPWLMGRLRAGDAVRVSRLAELPTEAETDRRTCALLSIGSMAAVPLRAAGAVIGGLVVASGLEERAGAGEALEELDVLGEVVASAFAGALAAREAVRLRQELTHISRVSALGELTASLAHEVNQPLTAILNNAQTAQRFLDLDAPNLEELREILRDIVTDDRRAAAVIRRVRSLVSKEGLEHLLLDINDVVNEVAQLVKSDLAMRSVSMALELALGLPKVRGDRVQLQQVVLNMVLNGVEAMGGPDGRRHTLVIRTSAVGRAGVQVAVEDSGPGLDVEGIERLFEPLYSTKAEGLGMGLAIARTIIDAHGGQVSASNNGGGGATFQFTLPVGARG